MKFIIAALLLVSALAMALVAQANDFKSVNQCRSQIAGSLKCIDCCQTFDLVATTGRHSLKPLANFHVCKCITKEEDLERQNKIQEYWAKHSA